MTRILPRHSIRSLLALSAALTACVAGGDRADTEHVQEAPSSLVRWHRPQPTPLPPHNIFTPDGSNGPAGPTTPNVPFSSAILGGTTTSSAPAIVRAPGQPNSALAGLTMIVVRNDDGSMSFSTLEDRFGASWTTFQPIPGAMTKTDTNVAITAWNNQIYAVCKSVPVPGAVAGSLYYSVYSQDERRWISDHWTEIPDSDTQLAPALTGTSKGLRLYRVTPPDPFFLGGAVMVTTGWGKLPAGVTGPWDDWSAVPAGAYATLPVAVTTYTSLHAVPDEREYLFYVGYNDGRAWVNVHDVLKDSWSLWSTGPGAFTDVALSAAATSYPDKVFLFSKGNLDSEVRYQALDISTNSWGGARILNSVSTDVSIGATADSDGYVEYLTKNIGSNTLNIALGAIPADN